MTASRHWANLGIAAGAVAATQFALFDLTQWAQAYASDHFHNDFTFYYAAARVGLNHGWSSIYDLSLLQGQLDAIGSSIKIAALARFISPPPLAWLAAPFTLLPYEAGYFAWSGLLLAALGLTWRVAAPGSGPTRLILLAAALGWLPVIYCLQLGQPGLLVALGVALSFAALRSGRNVAAGVALALLALKPQLAFLVPLALVVAGRFRAFASVLAAGTVLAAASAVAIGPDGISTYLDRLNLASTVPVNRDLTLYALIGDVNLTRAIQVVVALWTLALVFRFRRREVEWLYVTAIFGGLLATPYAHLDDYVMLGLALWLWLRVGGGWWILPYALIAIGVVEGEPNWGPAPVIVIQLAGLALLTLEALLPSAANRRDAVRPAASETG